MTAPTDEAGQALRHAALRTSMCVALVLLCVYVLRAAPTTYLLDSAELVATTFGLGISHPPGHPGYHLSTALLSVLPIGSVAFRVHLSSALAAAVALALLPWLAWSLGWAKTRVSLMLVATIAIGTGLTPIFAQQAIRAEVYALHALTMAIATVIALPNVSARPRTAAAAAVVLGFGLLNHHYLTVFAFPAFAWALLVPRGRRVRAALAGTTFGAMMLTGYAYLPVRALGRPEASWGWPDTLGEMWWLMSAQAFQKTAARATAMDPISGLTNVLGVLMECLTVPGFLFAVAGLVVLTLRERRIGLFVILATGANFATQFLFDFDPLNPDALGYFMWGTWCLALAAAYLVSQLFDSTDRRLPIGALFMVVGVAWVGLVHHGSMRGGRSVALPEYWDSELLRDEAQRGVEPDGLWITTYYETGFNAWFGRVVEDRRPDIEHVHQAFLTYPFYAEMLDERPRASGLIDAEGELTEARILGAAASFDTRIEAEQLVPQGVARQSVPTGLYLRVMPTPLPPGEFPAGVGAAVTGHLARARDRFGAAPETQTARNLLWATYNVSIQMCRAERYEACRAALMVARELSPGDPEIAAFSNALRDRTGRGLEGSAAPD